jgi:hypothetical protein
MPKMQAVTRRAKISDRTPLRHPQYSAAKSFRVGQGQSGYLRWASSFRATQGTPQLPYNQLFQFQSTEFQTAELFCYYDRKLAWNISKFPIEASLNVALSELFVKCVGRTPQFVAT